MVKYDNQVKKVNMFNIWLMQDEMKEMGDKGYKLVSTELKEGGSAIFLFFTKEIGND